MKKYTEVAVPDFFAEKQNAATKKILKKEDPLNAMEDMAGSYFKESDENVDGVVTIISCSRVCSDHPHRRDTNSVVYKYQLLLYYLEGT